MLKIDASVSSCRAFQISPISWCSMRAFDLVIRNFECPASVDLFPYLFDVVRYPSRDSRRMRQGFIDLIPSSSGNLFASYIIDGFFVGLY